MRGNNKEGKFFAEDEILQVLKYLGNEPPKWQAYIRLQIDTCRRRSLNCTKDTGVYESYLKERKNPQGLRRSGGHGSGRIEPCVQAGRVQRAHFPGYTDGILPQFWQTVRDR